MGNTLRIPTVDDVEKKHKKNVQVNPNPNKVYKEQMHFELDAPQVKIKQIWNTILDKLKYRADMMKYSLLWHDPSLSFSIMSFLLNILTLLFGAIFFFNDLPLRINFFYDSLNNKWILLDKSVIFVFPFFYLIFFIVILRMIIYIVKKDKNFVNMISWIMTFLNSLLFISIGMIFKLVT